MVFSKMSDVFWEKSHVFAYFWLVFLGFLVSLDVLEVLVFLDVLELLDILVLLAQPR